MLPVLLQSSSQSYPDSHSSSKVKEIMILYIKLQLLLIFLKRILSIQSSLEKVCYSISDDAAQKMLHCGQLR